MKIQLKAGRLAFKNGKINLRVVPANAYVITSGYISGGQDIVNQYVSYNIKFGSTTLKSGSIRLQDGNINLTPTDITTFNTAMGTGGGTFTVLDLTDSVGSYTGLTLIFSTNGSGSTTKTAESLNDSFNGNQYNGYLTIP